MPHHHLLDRHFRRPRLQRFFWARPRLFGCTLLGLALILILHAMAPWRTPTQLLVAWNISMGLYLLMVWSMMARSSEERMKLRAQIQDEGQLVVLLLTVLASCACLTAIVAELSGLKDTAPTLRGLHVALAAFTILTAWLFVHTMFALHYAHDYYVGLVRGQPPCLQFPGECPRPSYSDFLYFAFIIGTSGQTADVSIASKPMRRLSLIHCVLAFFFNTTLLALTINIAASLIS
ncbi:MAG: DUF1345 domain-containing protein [Ancalomicrobiaceae bacterium]|nr:DUF1345 domain-containing protein [Ancalomicrobiaceae bacterium]